VKIQCRNGEGPLAQHLFPQSPNICINTVVVEGIEYNKLKDIADTVRQHRKRKGAPFLAQGFSSSFNCFCSQVNVHNVAKAKTTPIRK
jgi:hypothetical protein